MMAIRRAEVDKEEMVSVNEKEAIEKNKEMKEMVTSPKKAGAEGRKRSSLVTFFFGKKHIWSLDFTYFLTK